MSDLKRVLEGLFDKKTNFTLQVRIVCSLGNNLEQNEIAGLRLNFSTMQHSCRKCLCELNDLGLAEDYDSIHARNQVQQDPTGRGPMAHYFCKYTILV